MYIKTKETVAKVAYLVGVREDIMQNHYCPEQADLLEKLKKDKPATIIRYLSKLRTALFQNFTKTDQIMMQELRNIDQMEWFDASEIRQLEEWGIPIIRANYRSEKYIMDFCALINNHIGNCAHLFYDWQRFDLIKELFRIQKYTKPGVTKQEFAKYMSHISEYPFQIYVNWKPEDCGNLLGNDVNFLKTLCRMHGEVFTARDHCVDAHEETKNNVYDFINENDKTVIVVDCENSDAFKFIGVMRSLKQEEIEKVDKIVLYDDPNTSSSWDYISKYVKIPVEHVEVDRVVGHKSLVDVAMTSGVCKEFYVNGTSAFIILSSDSDYWGLIRSLPEAKFLVMYEYSKCGQAIKDALESRGCYYCAIDDFYRGNTEDFKKAILFDALRAQLPDLSALNGKEIAEKVFTNTKVYASEKEVRNFFCKYVKTIRIKISENGDFEFEIGG